MEIKTIRLTGVLSLLIITCGLEAQKIQENFSVTTNTVQVEGRGINYQATAGFFPLADEAGNKRADLFFVYYQKKEISDVANRPLTFAFNGGPGSPSCWLHLGAMGPYRLMLDEEGNVPAPPYAYTANNASWLDQTDLVFIDPVYTGLSRPASGVDKNEFMGFEKDVAYLSDFVRQFINRFNRWSSPKYIAGESYGSIRAVGMVNYLQENYSIFFNGLLLISGLLDYGTLEASGGNELPYALRLPSIAAAGWYHKKIGKDTDLHSLLKEVEGFTVNNYLPALFAGNELESRDHLIQKLVAYTGLPEPYIRKTNLRFVIGELNTQYFEKEGMMISRLDSRLKGHQIPGTSVNYSFDPGFEPLIKAPYLSVSSDYIKNKLNFDFGPLNYDIISGRTYPWDFNSPNRYLDVTHLLANAMSKNPSLRVWVSGGLFDLATPYFAAKYSLQHTWIHPDLTKNLSTSWYAGGHMFYHDKEVLKKFKQDAIGFYNK